MRIRRVVVRVEGPAVTPARARALAEQAIASAAAELAMRPVRSERRQIGALRVRVETSRASTVDDRTLPDRIGRAVRAALAEQGRW